MQSVHDLPGKLSLTGLPRSISSPLVNLFDRGRSARRGADEAREGEGASKGEGGVSSTRPSLRLASKPGRGRTEGVDTD